MSNTLATPTSSPNATRPTCPDGTVLGSVIMKNRKIRTSGEVTIVRQKSLPHTGVNDQSVIMQWPEPASTPVPSASESQNAPAIGSRCSRRVISRPPTMITAYAAIIGRLSGAHQKSRGSTRALPSTRNATTSPMFDGLNTCEPRYLMTYLVSSETPATTANTYQSPVYQGWSAGVPTTRRISATPLPVSIALAGHTKDRLCRNVIATSSTAQVMIAARICGHADLEVQPDLAQDVDRDDHRGDVEARVLDAGQEQRVGGAADGEGARSGALRRSRHRVTRRTWSAATSWSSVAVPSAHSIRTRSAVAA